MANDKTEKIAFEEWERELNRELKRLIWRASPGLTGWVFEIYNRDRTPEEALSLVFLSWKEAPRFSGAMETLQERSLNLEDFDLLAHFDLTSPGVLKSPKERTQLRKSEGAAFNEWREALESELRNILFERFPGIPATFLRVYYDADRLPYEAISPVLMYWNSLSNFENVIRILRDRSEEFEEHFPREADVFAEFP